MLISNTPYVVTDSLPDDIELDFNLLLFDLWDHRLLQSEDSWQSYYLISRGRKKALASVHFCIKDGVAYSPFKAPYSSFSFSKSLASKNLFEFIQYCEQALKRKKVERIVIKGGPQIDLEAQHSVVSTLLLNRGFEVARAELNACLIVNDTAFSAKLDRWEKRKLRQSIDAGLCFKTVPLASLKDVYHFIQTCRRERVQHLSMTFEELRETVEKLTDKFFLFGVYRGNNPVAASISIRVSDTILYNFYTAHAHEADSLSPVVLLTEGIYTWCASQHIHVLDLGTSALHEEPNFSLIDFKLRLGATPAMRLVFQKKIT